MGKFAIVENGKVVYRGVLPKNWKNTSNLYLLADDLESLKAKGILPLEEVTPDYNPATHRQEGWTEDIQEDKVVLTWNIREKTQGELDDEVKQRTVAYKAYREAEYPRADELLFALWEKVMEGRPEEADALEAKRQAIKAKYPKPKGDK